MKYVELGRIGIRASILGMGGREYLQNGKSRGLNEDFKRSMTPEEILEGFDQEDRLAILRSSYELGINFFNVTQDSEKEALGRNLKQLPPPYDVVIQARPEDVVYTYGKNNTKMTDLILLRNEVQRILKLLQRETTDFFSIAPMRRTFGHGPEYLEKLSYNIPVLKQKGLIRFTCIGTFSGEGTYLRMIQSSYFDIIYINFNFTDYQAQNRVMRAAKTQKMGAITREAYMKRQLLHMAEEAGIEQISDLADAILRWSLSREGVDMVIYRTGKPEHLRDASEALENRFSELDERLINRIMQTQLYKACEAEKNKEFLEL